MRNFSRYLLTFALMALPLTAATGGCSSIGEAIDCDQICNELEACVDSDLNVHRCAERCEDKAEDDVLSEQLDDCTDCLDRDYACGEIPDKCPMCQAVTDAIWE